MLRPAMLSLPLLILCASLPAEEVRVEILEGVPDKKGWDFAPPAPVDAVREPAFALVGVPHKFSAKGHVLDRSNPLVLRAAPPDRRPRTSSRSAISSSASAGGPWSTMSA